MSNLIQLIFVIVIYSMLVFIPLIFLRKRLIKYNKLKEVEPKEKLKVFAIFVAITIITGLITFFIVPYILEKNQIELSVDTYRLDKFYSSLATIIEFSLLSFWGLIFAKTMYQLTIYKDKIFKIFTAFLFIVGYYYQLIIILLGFFGFMVSYQYPFKIIEYMVDLLIFLPMISYLGTIIYFIIKINKK